MGYEYKCVGAPERTKRKRGAKTRSDRVAAAMQEIIAAQSTDGWEYQRTDLVPMEEKSGLFSRSHEVHRAVLVFRRPLSGATAVAAPVVTTPAAEPVAAPVAAPVPEPAPPTPAPEPTPVVEEEPIRLAADADEAPSSAAASVGSAARPAPSGLG